MADISKCADDKCPSRERCYRYRAIPDEFQTYANFQRKADEDKCARWFWPVGKEKDNS